MSWITEDQIRNQFSFHPPASTETAELHEAVRGKLRELAYWFNEKLPEGPTKTVAIGKLREAMFYANASIACDTPPKE